MTTIHAHRTAARRFFWAWLIGSAVVSILGNVTHAVLGDAPSPVIASVTAFFIVVIQLCSTYGAHALVQARIVGAAYRVALCIAVALAVGAFVLMWVALRDLVITWAGYPAITAWIVPLIVDLGITGSTVALLALTNADRAEQLHPRDDAQPVAQADCRAFVALYYDEMAFDWHEGVGADDICEWEPATPESREHKRQWLDKWRSDGKLYPIPTATVTDVCPPGGDDPDGT